jgi:cation transport regulator ChaB
VQKQEGALPYARNQDLPANVKTPLPSAAQTLFRRVVNGRLAAGQSEEAAFRQAWSAVGQQYEKPKNGGKWVHKRMAPMFGRRPLENAAEVIAHFKEQGFKTAQLPRDMHVTLAYSKQAVDWPDQDDDSVIIRSPRDRAVAALGDGGAIVLKFYSPTLTRRWAELCEHGCAWEHDSFTPHVTITWDAGDVDLSKVEPYKGELRFGPEIFSPIDENWEGMHTEKREPAYMAICKVDRKHGLIFGWAIVSKVGGEEYYDLQGDHIPEDAMFDAAVEFMQKRRTMKLMHKGEKKGEIVFAWPLTDETAKAMGLTSDVTGLMIAAKPSSKKVLDDAEAGKLTGFSIGGQRVEDEEVEPV